MAGLAAVVLATAAWQWQRSMALRVERDLARLQVEDVMYLRRENERLAREQVSADELAALRADHATLPRLRAELAALEKASAAPESVTLPPSSNLRPLSNQGWATPEAAIQTAFWALAAGETEMLSRMVHMAGPARAFAAAAFERLPEETRRRFGNPELMVTTLMSDPAILRPVTGFQVLGVNRDDDANVTVRTRTTTDASGRTRENEARFHHSPQGWQWVLSETVVKAVVGKAPSEPAKAEGSR